MCSLVFTGGKTVETLKSFFNEQVKLSQTWTGDKTQRFSDSFSEEDSLIPANLCVIVIDYIAPYACKMCLLQTSFGNPH